MNKVLLFSGVYLLGVIISSIAQILLKKAADVKHESKIKEYLNFKTMFAYSIFFGATLCTVFAYKYVPLSMGPILGATEYIFVAILSYFFLKEKVSKRKLIGLITIVAGVLIFSMPADVINNKYFAFAVIAIATALMFLFVLQLKNDGSKVDKIFWVILILSLIIIFPNFLFQKSYYMYDDVGSDTINQYYPYLVNEVENIKDGTLSTWNFDYGLGTSMINMNAWTFDAFSIFTVIGGLIFGAGKVHILLVWMQVLKIIVLYILTKRFLSYFIKDRLSLCLAAYLGTMNGYIFLWGQHFFLGTACIYMLLILCVIEHILSKKSKKGYIYLAIVIASLLIFTYYIGYMVLIISAIYYFFRYIYIHEKIKIKETAKDFGKTIYSVITGMLVGGIIFIPSCYHIVTTSSRITGSEGILTKLAHSFQSSFDLQFLNMRFSRLLSNNMLFINDNSRFEFTNYYELPQLFCTIFIVFFIVQWIIYDFKKDKTKKDYIFTILKIIALYLLIFNNATGLILNGFTYAAYRYTYVVIPFIALIIGIVFEKVIREKKINHIGTVISLLLSAGICIYSYNNSIDNSKLITLIVSGLLAAGFCLIPFINGKNKYANVFMSLFVFLIIMSSCFENYMTTNARKPVYAESYLLEWDDSELVTDTGKALNWIKENDKTVYRVEQNYSNFASKGDSLIEQVSTNTWYNSTMTNNMSAFYSKIYYNANITDAVKFFRLNDDSDTQALYLTNSKYILSEGPLDLSEVEVFQDYDGFEEINRFGDIYIYRNKATDSIAKWYSKTMTSKEFESLDKSVRANMLYSNVIIDDKVSIDSGSEAIIGDFVRDGDRITGSVDSNGKGILMLSIPNDEGWEVYIDGQESKLYEADYGFLGVVVSEGEHSVELKYHIPMIKEGAIVSLIGLVSLVIMCFLSREKKVES